MKKNRLIVSVVFSVAAFLSCLLSVYAESNHVTKNSNAYPCAGAYVYAQEGAYTSGNWKTYGLAGIISSGSALSVAPSGYTNTSSYNGISGHLTRSYWITVTNYSYVTDTVKVNDITWYCANNYVY